MAVWALLSISQTVKADDFFIKGAFDRGSSWTKLDGKSMDPVGNNQYSQTYQCTKAGEYRFRFIREGWNGEMCPEQSSYNLTNASCKVYYTDQPGRKDNYFYVNMESGKTYTFTFDNSSESNRTVACTVGGSTSPSEFEKLYLIGGLYNDRKDDTTRPFTTTDGKVYEYVFDSDYTNKFNQESDYYYFRVKTATSQHYQPQTNDAPVETEFTSANPGSSIAWKFTMTKGKSYTLIFDYENKRIRYLEGVSKKIQLLNGTSELTGSNGKYTLDLSGETSSDANITLTIDGAEYRLATAQTISTAGTTSGIAFTTEGTAALTLKAGLIYSLSVTEDGKMTVVAKEKGVADGNYYLVGNFFEEDLDKINYDKKYFRFTNSKGDGTLTFDIPASLAIKAQVYASDGTCYGPVTDNGKTFLEISKTKPTADAKSVDGKLVAGSNYWTFTERGLDETGIYTITITVDAAGTPTKWDVTYDKSKRMAYFLVDPTKDPDAVVHPAYAVVKEDRSCNNNFYGNIYLEAGQHCFVVGNLINGYNDDVTGHPVKTTKKLYLQGNGGLDPTTDVAGSEKAQYTNVLPNKDGFTYNETKLMLLEYNPTRGNGDDAQRPENHGICGEILKASTQITDQNDPITSIQIVGNGVVDSWKLDKAQNMKYNKTLDCWEYTFRTEKAESVDNKFRFIANKGWKYNWGEESSDKKDQARPYTDTNPENGHEASLKDPNQLNLTKNGSETDRNGSNTYGDMYFNRPAGEWTIRFYIRTILDESGNNYKAVYAYTITGSASNDVILTYCNGQFIRTYSNSKAMNPDNDNVKIYEVYRYDKPAEETEPGKVDNIYAKGTVHLRRLNYIPANVGVVLIGVVPADGEYTENQQLAFSLLERTEDSEIAATDSCKLWRNAETYIKKGDKWNNYLVPTVQANNNLGNAYVDQSGKITYRYFGLSHYYQTKYHQSLGAADTQPDYLGFFRLTSNGKSGANRAYLAIPANAEVGSRVGATYGYIDFNGQLLENKFHDHYEAETPAKFANMAMIFDDLIEGNETTGIKELETEVLNNNKYYNLQGIEVAYPVKGIYIHNGKKVIVK